MKKILMSLILSVLFCSTALAGYVEDITEVNQKISQAVSDQDLNEVMSHYTKQTTFLAPGAPVIIGREGVGAFYQAAMAQGAVGLELTTIEFKKITPKRVIEVGQNKIHFFDPSSNQTFTQENKYLVIWKKTKSGWKVDYDAYNALP